MLAETNLLIESLSPAMRDKLLAVAEEVDLSLRFSLQSPEEKPKYAYFLTSGLASVVVNLAEGGTAETAIIGREGLTGALSLLGTSVPPTACFMQLDGEGYRVPLRELQKMFHGSDEVRNRILACVQQQVMTTSQLAACNRLHEAEARLARWFLMIRDRTNQSCFQITQEFLSEMLGTRRTTVALVAGTLQRAGLIEYSRGKVTINSPEKLETVACDCYLVTRRLLRDLYQQHAGTSEKQR